MRMNFWSTSADTAQATADSPSRAANSLRRDGHVVRPILPTPGSARIGLWVVLLLLTGWFMQAAGQIGANGSINGTVVDGTGAVVKGATVTGMNVATGATFTQATSAGGTYVLSPLPPGQYTVTIVAKGFKTFTQEHINVDALQLVGLKSTLSVGSSEETVTVTGAPPQLDTTNAAIGLTIENQEYTALPLQMSGGPRNPTAFVYLTPGVAKGGAGVQTGIFNGSGSQGRVDEIYIDGMPQTSIYEQGDPRYVSNIISVEAVDQFQVITSNPAAQYQGIGMENYTVKAGTNQIHGSVFEYFRTTALDTWGYFAPAAINPSTGTAVKPNEHQSEYGVVLGGPIRKDKIFLFGNYDGYYFHKDNNPSYTTIPTLLMRTGNFTELDPNINLNGGNGNGSDIYDPNSCPVGTQGAANHCNRSIIQYNGQYDVMNPAAIGSAEQFMIKFMPKPINTNITNNYLSEIPSFTHHWDTAERLDWKITDKQNFDFIFGAELGGVYGYQSNGSNPGPLPYTSGQGYETKNKLFILEHTYTLTSNLVNQLKYGYSRFWGPVFNPDYRNKGYGLGTDGGVTGLPAGQASESFPTVTFGGVNPLTQWSGDQDYNAMTNYFTLLDNVQWIHGRHSFTFGFVKEWLELNDYTFSTGTSPVTLAYSNAQTGSYNNAGTLLATSGNAFASLLLGQVGTGSLNQLPFTDTGARIRDLSLYAQDDYSVTPKLTLNLGLRWDFFPPYTEVQNRSSWFEPYLTNPLTGNMGALVFAGSGGSPHCGCSTPVTNWYKNFGPRLGAAYSVLPKTVLRAGLSLTYSHGTGSRNATYLGTGATGYSAAPSFTATTTGDEGFNLNNGFPAYAPPPTISASYGTYYTTQAHGAAAGMSYPDPYLGDRAPYAINFNFGIEQQLTNDIAFQLNYVGSRSHFLPVTAGGARGYYNNQLNPAYYNLGGLLSSTETPATLAQAQAIDPGIALPYPTFSGTIAQMLTPFPQYSGVADTYDNIANAQYDSLQFVLRQRMAHGLQFMFNYTYSAEIDDDGTYRDGYLPTRRERSRGINDTPQVINATAVYKLPFGAGYALGGGNVVSRALTGGWELSGIYTYSSGVPLAIVASGCTTPGGGQCMPNYNTNYSGPVRINGKYGANMTAKSPVPYIAYQAFSLPAPYTFGNVARTKAYGLRGPTSFDMDMSLKKDIPIHNNVHALFDISAYNVTNSVVFGLPATTSTTTTTFGEVTGQANNSRDIQLALRVNF